MTKILVPVDGSPHADKAVRFAVTLTTGKEAEIILVNVQPSYNTPNVKRFIDPDEVKAFQEESAKEVFDHSLETLKNLSIAVRTVTRLGDPGREICVEAKESGADLIVMGYRGLGAVQRAILGSVATHVLHETPCPLTIVP